jgi:hypothetical protein
LEYRNDELIIWNSKAMHKSSESMREIAMAAKAENRAVALLLAKAQKDSRTVKILTFVAMLYLPASLIAVSCVSSVLMISDSDDNFHMRQTIFSSQLVQFSPAETTGAQQGFHLSNEFWVYPVFTFVLMVITLIPAAWWGWWLR